MKLGFLIVVNSRFDVSVVVSINDPGPLLKLPASGLPEQAMLSSGAKRILGHSRLATRHFESFM